MHCIIYPNARTPPVMIFLAGEFYEASRKLAQWHYFSSSGNVKYIAEYLLLLLKSLQLFRTKIRLIYQHLVGSGNVFIRNLFSSGAFFQQKPFFIKNIFSSGAFYCQEPFIIRNLFFRNFFHSGGFFS
jgi:hypothetical protein